MQDLTPEASPAENPFRHAAWRTYTPADGLAGLHPQQIAQDRDGYLWFATFHTGVSRFDGETFRTFTRDDGLAGNIVMATLCDSRGRMWFGTLDGGACWYDGRTFHRMERPDGYGFVSHMFEDRDGRIWMVGLGMLCYLDGEQMCNLRPELRRDCDFGPSQCRGIAQDREGCIWLGMGYLVRYDGRQDVGRQDVGDRFHALGPEDGFPRQRAFYAVGAGDSGDVWIGDRNRVLRYDGDRFHTVLEQEELRVRTITRDREGRMWICAGDIGVY